jgi:predicted ATP-dependent serine protease
VLVTPLNTHRTDAVEEAAVHVTEDSSMLRDRRLDTSILQLDELIGGFRSAQVTLLESDNRYVSSLLHLLCVRAVSVFGEEVVWIDGGNSINPYAISSLCKRLGLDKREVLSSINVSRAFTAYQLVTLIDEKLEEQVEGRSPSTVIVSSITEMFLDKDMKWMESHQLLRRCLERISKVAKEHETISLTTNFSEHPLRPSPKLSGLLYEHSDQVVQIRARRDGMLFRLPRADRQIVFMPVPWNQLTLDEFRGDSDGKNSGYIPIGT